ncbi:MAG TPA: metalloregulator ArsR/SmtB family transcription factor [Acidimicrobiia bacterium]|nr:metalloregulator ArsR/SmtB family transcription factor [Acidimicrobiia bacterium]
MESLTTSACCTPIAAGLSPSQAEDLAATLKVLADPARIRIVSMLATVADGEVCVCDLTDPLDLSQPTVSHHMKQLREAGFVESERRGKWVYHRLVPDRLAEVRQALTPSDAFLSEPARHS